jgi:hypothetical protein
LPKLHIFVEQSQDASVVDSDGVRRNIIGNLPHLVLFGSLLRPIFVIISLMWFRHDSEGADLVALQALAFSVPVIPSSRREMRSSSDSHPLTMFIFVHQFAIETLSCS